MKILLSALLALVCSGCSTIAIASTASAITVVTPTSGAQVPSPFKVVASSSTCGSVPAVSMGYSIDSGSAVIEPTSFTAYVSASAGSHTLHVKCWGKGTAYQVLIPITVGQSGSGGGGTTSSDIAVSTPLSGASVSSPFTVVASSQTCGGVSTAAMGYSIDNSSAVIEPTSFTAAVTATSGLHTLHVKCWGHGTAEQVLVPVNVGQSGTGGGTGGSQDIVVASPASGAKLSAPFTVVASSKTCGGVSTAAMGYSIDSGSAVIEPTSFSAAVTTTSGSHTLHVKCWGKGTAEQVLLPITVGTGSDPATATPQFSLPSGTYTGKQYVSLSDATTGSTIYYTTDGSGPSTASPRYSGPIPVASSMVIEALATSTGNSNSGLGRANYVINNTTSGPSIPSNALKDTEIQLMPNWRTKHDPATGGTATGTMSIVSAPSFSGGQVAKYATSYSNYGGVLYSVTYDKDAVPTNFVYDAEVWIGAGSAIGNLEMDNNQVIANGDTVIYAFQCAGDSNTWDYSENAGTRANPIVKWIHSNQTCNPANWTKNAWHHVQIQTSRDDVGNVTYHSVWLDGVEYPINQTVMSAFSLNWAAADLIANFQVDGPSAGGSSTLYLDNFTIYRW